MLQRRKGLRCTASNSSNFPLPTKLVRNSYEYSVFYGRSLKIPLAM